MHEVEVYMYVCIFCSVGSTTTAAVVNIHTISMSYIAELFK